MSTDFSWQHTALLTVSVAVTVHTSGKSAKPVQVTITGSDGSNLASHNGTTDQEFSFTAESPKLWWPDSPTLYNLTVTLDSGDVVHSYTGFRTISKGKVENVTRPLLNGEFVFQFGTLDQGYWPDGLYTPPNREAMVSDVKLLKKFGFNMVRKHVSTSILILELCTNFHRSNMSLTSSIKPAMSSVFSLFKTCLVFQLATGNQMMRSKLSSGDNLRFLLISTRAIRRSRLG